MPVALTVRPAGVTLTVHQSLQHPPVCGGAGQVEIPGLWIQCVPSHKGNHLGFFYYRNTMKQVKTHVKKQYKINIDFEYFSSEGGWGRVPM